MACREQAKEKRLDKVLTKRFSNILPPLPTLGAAAISEKRLLRTLPTLFLQDCTMAAVVARRP